MPSDPAVTSGGRGSRAGQVVGTTLGVLALAATAACTGTVSGSEVEQQVAATAKRENVDATDVSCPELSAEKGERVTCTLSVQGRKLRLVVEVRSTKGTKVTYFLNPPTAAG